MEIKKDSKVKKLKAKLLEQNKELKSAKKEIVRLQKEIIHLDAQKEEFISMAAHELRAPTTAIKGYISMVLEGDAGDISERARGFLTDARATNERLIRLVSNMLNVSRIEKGKIVYQLERVSLGKVALQVYDDFKYEAGRKNLKFTVKASKNVNDHIYIDPNRVHEVVTNLVSNAIKYTDVGQVSIRVKKSDDNKYVRLEVEDSGPGIAEEERSKLFKKFYRINTTAGKTIGTGLGLYICKLIVKNFKGKIGVTSRYDKGSIFWVELPLIEDL
jgi:signal transduction histidine kinase